MVFNPKVPELFRRNAGSDTRSPGERALRIASMWFLPVLIDGNNSVKQLGQINRVQLKGLLPGKQQSSLANGDIVGDGGSWATVLPMANSGHSSIDQREVFLAVAAAQGFFTATRRHYSAPAVVESSDKDTGIVTQRAAVTKDDAHRTVYLSRQALFSGGVRRLLGGIRDAEQDLAGLKNTDWYPW